MRKKAKKKIGKVAAGTALGALLAAGAAAFFFTQTKVGKDAGKKIKEEATHLSKEISHRVSTFRKMSQEKYDEIVDDIVDEYGKKKKLAGTQMDSLKRDLKSHWKEVSRELKSDGKTAKRAVTKTVKKTVSKRK